MTLADFPKIIWLIVLLLLTACSGKEVDPTEGLSAAEIYNLAKDNMESENYLSAIQFYESLESRYPFGVYATQAQLDVAYAYYLYDEPESATAAVNRFIKLHPQHDSVDYAYYLKGLINFGLRPSILDYVYTPDLSEYDKSIMLKSYRDFSVLLNRFPKSKYSRDAKKRMVFLRNQLAKSELNVAKYYLNRKAWVAVANRTKNLLTTYQGSSSIKEALQMQLLAYQQLQLTDLIKDTRRILVLNYGEQAAQISIEDFS